MIKTTIKNESLLTHKTECLVLFSIEEKNPSGKLASSAIRRWTTRPQRKHRVMGDPIKRNKGGNSGGSIFERLIRGLPGCYKSRKCVISACLLPYFFVTPADFWFKKPPQATSFLPTSRRCRGRTMRLRRPAVWVPHDRSFFIIFYFFIVDFMCFRASLCSLYQEKHLRIIPF